MNSTNLLGIMKMSDKTKHNCNCFKHLMSNEHFFLTTDFPVFFNKNVLFFLLLNLFLRQILCRIFGFFSYWTFSFFDNCVPVFCQIFILLFLYRSNCNYKSAFRCLRIVFLCISFMRPCPNSTFTSRNAREIKFMTRLHLINRLILCNTNVTFWQIILLLKWKDCNP